MSGSVDAFVALPLKLSVAALQCLGQPFMGGDPDGGRDGLGLHDELPEVGIRSSEEAARVIIDDSDDAIDNVAIVYH